MPTYYLDASSILRRLLADGRSLVTWGEWAAAYTSEVAEVEVNRALIRAASERRLSSVALRQAQTEFANLSAALRWVPLSRSVIQAASGPLPGALKALDAIHIGTAIVLRAAALSDLVFATFDRRQAETAASLGFAVESE